MIREKASRKKMESEKTLVESDFKVVKVVKQSAYILCPTGASEPRIATYCILFGIRSESECNDADNLLYVRDLNLPGDKPYYLLELARRSNYLHLEYFNSTLLFSRLYGRRLVALAS